MSDKFYFGEMLSWHPPVLKNMACPCVFLRYEDDKAVVVFEDGEIIKTDVDNFFRISATSTDASGDGYVFCHECEEQFRCDDANRMDGCECGLKS